MPKKKITWEGFQEGREYLLWGRLFDMAKELNMTGANFVSSEDSGSGVYWEPFLVLLFKFGNILKQTGKLKEIKMDWIRPLNYLGAQSNEKVVFDGDNYIIDKGAISNAANLKFALQHLLDSINQYDAITEQTFQKDYKTLVADSNYFFKKLIVFVKDGFRPLHENIKLILKPLRVLRKAGYKLVSLEKEEENYEDLTMFHDKKAMKSFVTGIQQFMANEEYKMKRDCDLNQIDKYLGMTLNRDFYQYKFNNKLRGEDEKKEKEKEKEKETIAEPKKGTRKKKLLKSQSQEELLAIKFEEERKHLTYININNLRQRRANRFKKEAIQKEFETGLDLTLKHLNRKLPKMFPFEIEAHKIFVNLNCIPNGKTAHETGFYLKQLDNEIEILKVKLYEMKLNGLSRILIPISKNTDFVNNIKRIYDLHSVIDRILGDKLLHEQFLFLYSKIAFLVDSTMKEDLEVYKTKNFMEVCVPRYLVFLTLVHSAKVLLKMKDDAKSRESRFKIEDYYQPTKHLIDSEDNLVLNAYELKDSLIKALTDEIRDKERLFWTEVKKFGRFWLMEGYFPPEDKQMWLDAIEILSNINPLVQDDMKDMILHNNEDKLKKEQRFSSTINIMNKTCSSNSYSNSNTIENKEEVKVNELEEKQEKPEKTLHRHPTLSKRNTISLKAGKGGELRRGTTKNLGNKAMTKRRRSTRDITGVDEDASLNATRQKIEALRPPRVWNFPVERLILPFISNPKKNEHFKNEIRKVNPFVCYHDRRVDKFFDLFDIIFKNLVNYCHKKGNIWEYVYCKILNVFSIDYQFAPTFITEKDPKKPAQEQGAPHDEEQKIEEHVENI